jgi:hypothetical protein
MNSIESLQNRHSVEGDETQSQEEKQQVEESGRNKRAGAAMPYEFGR